MSKAFDDVLAERQRQIAMGFDAAHDDEHAGGELGHAAACYAAHYIHRQDTEAPPAIWPFEAASYQPEGYRANLVKAAALILAEIERVDRLPQGTVESAFFPHMAMINPRS